MTSQCNTLPNYKCALHSCNAGRSAYKVRNKENSNQLPTFFNASSYLPPWPPPASQKQKSCIMSLDLLLKIMADRGIQELNTVSP